jgi:hypothetical protein
MLEQPIQLPSSASPTVAPQPKVRSRRPMIMAKDVKKDFMIGKEPYHALRGLTAPACLNAQKLPL